MVRVSVVVPFLDAARYLPEAIASVQTQTCHDWEMLVMTTDRRTVAQASLRELPAPILESACLDAPPGRQLAPQRHVISVFWRPAESSWLFWTPTTFRTSPTTCSPGYKAFEAHPEVMMVYGPTRWWHPGAERRDWT